MTILQFWLLSMLTSDGTPVSVSTPVSVGTPVSIGTPVSVGAPGQCIVAMYVLSGCESPLNFVVMMLEVMAWMVTCMVMQIVFIF